MEALDHPGDDQLLLDWVRDTCCCPVSYHSRLSNPLFPHHSPYLMRTAYFGALVDTAGRLVYSEDIDLSVHARRQNQVGVGVTPEEYTGISY